MKMIVNPKTKLLLDAFAGRPSSSIIVAGSSDTGVEQIINDLVEKLLDKPSRHDIVQVKPEDGKVIVIEQVRDFKKSLTSLVKSKSDIARVAIVWSADTTTKEGQNALLKLIEEPAKQTLLILQVSDRKLLLPTILSRCQTIPVLPITKAQAVEYAKSLGLTEETAQKALLFSSGESKLFSEYLENNSESSGGSILEAKQFISEPVFSRVQKSKQYEKSEQIHNLLNDIEKLSTGGLHNSIHGKHLRWVGILKEVKSCRLLLNKNVSPKLIFIRLCISI